MGRSGLYGVTKPGPCATPFYLTGFLGVLTLIGLWLLRDVRRHLELEW
jgi:hypothetical protein